MQFHQSTPLTERNDEEPQPTRPFLDRDDSAHIDDGGDEENNGRI
jgi:hypothetical protein